MRRIFLEGMFVNQYLVGYEGLVVKLCFDAEIQNF